MSLLAAAGDLLERMGEHGAAALELVSRIDLDDDRIAISVNLDALLPTVNATADLRPIELTVPVSRLRSIRETRNVIVASTADTPAADPSLIKLLASAHAAAAAMRSAGTTALADIAARHGYTPAYFTMLLRLTTLAPDIVEAIVAGRQPGSLTRQRLANVTSLPLDWAGQRAALGFWGDAAHSALILIRSRSHLPTAFQPAGE